MKQCIKVKGMAKGYTLAVGFKMEANTKINAGADLEVSRIN